MILLLILGGCARPEPFPEIQKPFVPYEATLRLHFRMPGYTWSGRALVIASQEEFYLEGFMPWGGAVMALWVSPQGVYLQAPWQEILGIEIKPLPRDLPILLGNLLRGDPPPFPLGEGFRFGGSSGKMRLYYLGRTLLEVDKKEGGIRWYIPALRLRLEFRLKALEEISSPIPPLPPVERKITLDLDSWARIRTD